MSEFPHLSRAPINEAMLTFQANAAAHWGDADLFAKLKELWPAHSDAQELQLLNLQFSAKQGEQPKHDATNAQTMGWVFRSGTEPTAHQVRRDGYTFSRLKPYEDWDSFERTARANWEHVHEILQPEPLHAVGVRFLNLLEFPAADFKLKHYFTAPPPRPNGLDWSFHGFVQQAIFAVPDSQCAVQVTLSPSFSTTPTETQAFMLDIGVTLKESLPASGRSVDEVLSEMHLRKNEAFFGMLTDEAISLYK